MDTPDNRKLLYDIIRENVKRKVSILYGNQIELPVIVNEVAKAGESLYRDIVYPITKEFREQLHGGLLNVYHKKKEKQVKEARENVETQDKS